MGGAEQLVETSAKLTEPSHGVSVPGTFSEPIPLLHLLLHWFTSFKPCVDQGNFLLNTFPLIL